MFIGKAPGLKTRAVGGSQTDIQKGFVILGLLSQTFLLSACDPTNIQVKFGSGVK
jgi:hypothetical protein